ncbi:penicillin-binding protein PBP2A [Streptococcus dentapri]|uniref:Penicillin-binding protein PBP2A n=1 Tax=Streptococcus dentapri TaxID=573564 RepID=A0ABV8D211_9STRE
MSMTQRLESVPVHESPYHRSGTHSQKHKSRLDRLIDKYPKLAWVKVLIPDKQSWIRRFWRRYQINKILALGVSIFVLFTAAYLFYLAKTTNVSDLQDALKSSTVIYDKNGKEAGSLIGSKGTYVELDAISDDLENAVIATEDRSFYKNHGINYQRFILAILTAGKFGGGSTITQQLAKNAYLSQEQTITRKAKEFFLAVELDKKYSKKQILTMYLNNSYFGNGVWGVEDASQKYFGTSAANLTVDEAATLAGMLKGPEIYNPLYSAKNATNRRNTVLENMVNANYLKASDAASFKSVDISSRLSDTYVDSHKDYNYPSYFDAVVNEAINKYGISEKDILNNGYKIYTELDTDYQTGMQTVYSAPSLFPASPYDGSNAQSASVAVDPSTGGVRSLVGRLESTNDPTFRSYNYATQSSRSPGSTIKPLVVYSPALAQGYDIDEDLPNTVKDYNGYSPSNYGGIETKTIPMYQALANSYNIPAVYLLNEMGVGTAFDYGKKFGLNMDKVPKNLGVALGGSVTTNPLEMAQAYSTFANDGVMNEAHFITKIETASGKPVIEYKKSSSRVISKSVSDKMTSMMLGTFSNGTAVSANAYGYTMAGKTGTTETNFNEDLVGDEWIIGYTPDVVIAQWMGFEHTDENHYIVDDYGASDNVFSQVASYILPYTKGTEFTQENAYLSDGEGLTYDANSQDSNGTSDESKGIVDKIKDAADDASDKVNRAVEDSGIVDKAKDAWDTVKGWFQ